MCSANKVVIITSGQPNANPRVVKEATALDKAGYSVTVIYAPLSPWADDFDIRLFKKTPQIKWIRVGYHPVQERRRYAYVRLRRKFYQILSKRLPFLKFPAQRAFILYSQELEKKALKTEADLYIAHNLGALPAASMAASKWKKVCAFDAEDFHRGESNSGSDENRLVISIEDKYYPRAVYITTASPLISRRYNELFPMQKFHTVNNVFSRQFLQQPILQNKDELNLFWFSQTVGANRGIETVIEAMGLLRDLNINLYLLGQCSEEYKDTIRAIAAKPSSIHFVSPVPLEQIFETAGRYDIGLATEVPHIENRNICLTNKLFTYLLAGNCILASDTDAQKHFIETNEGVGLLYRYNDHVDLSDKIKCLYNYKDILHKMRETAYNTAKTKFNWENESIVFLKIVQSVMLQ